MEDGYNTDEVGGCEGVGSGPFPSDFEDRDGGEQDVRERMERA